MGGGDAAVASRMSVVFLISAAFHCALILAVIQVHGGGGEKCAGYETVLQVGLVGFAGSAPVAATPRDAGRKEPELPPRRQSSPKPLRTDRIAAERKTADAKAKNRSVRADRHIKPRHGSTDTGGRKGSAPVIPAESSVRPAGTGHGKGVKKGYLAENFIYIKNRITRHLSYPPVARRLKWQGIAVVTFYILENGLVENIKIARSSGHQLLDNHVVDTVRLLQPFPKPPVRAEITIPVRYILSD
jgi:TonB family protein